MKPHNSKNVMNQKAHIRRRNFQHQPQLRFTFARTISGMNSNIMTIGISKLILVSPANFYLLIMDAEISEKRADLKVIYQKYPQAIFR